MDRISVIMPLYNCAPFLEQSVRSVQNQTYPNWELIIVDDASRDNSYQQACRLAQSDPRIRVFKNPENRGVAACRNFAWQQTDGRYIAFLDSDDLWSKNKLRLQYLFMTRNNWGISHTAYAYMNDRGVISRTGLSTVDPVLDLKQYMKTTQVNVSTLMADRQQVPNLHFPEDRQLCEDARAWMDLMRQGHLFHGLNKVLTLYRVHTHQLSGNKFRMAHNTLCRYWREKQLLAPLRLYYFLHYAFNGVRKRIRPSHMNIRFVQERFQARPRL